MDLKSFGWEMFTILCQGTIGGLIVVFFSEWIKHRRQKVLLYKISDVMIVELETHLVFLERLLLNEPLIQKDIAVLKEHSYWFSNQELISEMDIEHFRIITYYFRVVFQTLERIGVREFQQKQIEILYLSAKQCICCFEIYCSDGKTNRAASLLELKNLESQIRELESVSPEKQKRF